MDVVTNDINDPVDWENEHQRREIINNICKIDSQDSTLTLIQLKDLFTIAKNALRFMVETKKSNAKLSTNGDEDSSTSSNYLYEVEKSNELKASLSEKKLYIKEILTDFQVTDEENRVLRERLENIKEKLSEATLHIQDLDIIMKNIKSENFHYNEQIESLKFIQASSQIQIKTLIETNKNHENQMEDFIQQMDFKLNEWKNVLDDKEFKITSLNREIHNLKNKMVILERKEPAFIEQMVKERDNQIEELQLKLSEATENIIDSTTKIEKLKSEIIQMESITENFSLRASSEPQEEIQIMESLRNDLQKYIKKTEELENCLKTREFEVADTLKKINSFESEGSMKEIIQKNKKVTKQLNVRDKQITDLVTENNSYKQLIEQLQFENSIMRKKLNIHTEELFDDSNILYKYGKIRKQLHDVQKKLSSSDEEKILLQIRLRQKEKNVKKLYEYLSSIGIKISDNFLTVALMENQAFEENNNSIQIDKTFEVEQCLNPENTTDNVSHTENDKNLNENFEAIKENYQQLVDENEGLRKCLNEILNAVKDKVTDSTCEINLPSVESLLHILDSRHVAGWYHPAMRMLMELNQEKGCQNNLRTMLKDARIEVTSTLDLLNQERQKNLNLENKLAETENNSQFETLGVLTDNDNENKFIVDEFNSINKENTYHIVTDGNTLNWQSYVKNVNRSYESILHENLKHFHEKFQVLSNNVIEIFTQSTEDKSQWQTMEEQYKCEIENLTSLLDSMKIRLDGIEKLKIFSEDSVENIDEIVKSNSTENKELKKNDKVNTENIQTVKEIKDELNPNISDVLHSIEHVDPNNISKIKSFVELFLLTLEKEKYFERKAIYAEKIFKFAKNEKDIIYNEFCDIKIKMLESNKQYEIKIQKLLFEVAHLRNQLRKSIPLTTFLQQNAKCNDLTMKYRRKLNDFQKLEFSNNDKPISAKFNCELQESELNEKEFLKMSNHIEYLENKNIHIQDQQNLIFDKIKSMWVTETIQIETGDVIEVRRNNESLKIDNIQLNSKILGLEEQVNTLQQCRLVHDLELNMLRHQILDLQSSNDDKAIIARLSSEILISHVLISNMHQKEDILNRNFENEKDKCKNLEEIIHEKNVQFHEYTTQFNLKISFLNFVIQTLKEQYHNAIPLYSLDILCDTKLELNNKLAKVQDREKELDLISLENKGISKEVKAILEEFQCTSNETQCHHYIEMKLNDSQLQFNNSVLKSKLSRTEEENKELLKKISSLNETLLVLNFTFNKEKMGENDVDIKNMSPQIEPSVIEIVDVDADVLDNYLPVPKPRTFVKKSYPSNIENNDVKNQDNAKNVSKSLTPKSYSTTTVTVQTEFYECLVDVSCQTNDYISDNKSEELLKKNSILQSNLEQSISLSTKRATEILNLQTENITLETKIKEIKKIFDDKDAIINNLSVEKEKLESNILKQTQNFEDKVHIVKITSVLENMKKIECQNDSNIEKYKELLNIEKAEHTQTRELAQKQIRDFKINMESLEKEYNSFKKMFNMTTENKSKDRTETKLLGLEEQCFHLKKDLDHKHTSTLSLKFECERWKNLAAERFSNMEMLKKQLEEMHNDEVISYKSEAAHWLAELTTAKNELNDVKIQLNEQRTSKIKQMSEKNSIIDKVHDTNNYLKQQLLNLQTIISERDPTFDFSTIITPDDYFDVDTNDEFKLNSIESEQGVFKNNFKTNRSENFYDRIQKEKQMLIKQNIILRKQVKIIATREHRLRIEKSHKRTGTDTYTNKIIQDKDDEIMKLQRKLEIVFDKKSANASGSTIKAKHMALWNKQKRWQESSEHWKRQFQEKCIELEQLQRYYESSKNIIHRLEKEKRSIDSRLSKNSKDESSPATTTDNESHLEMLLQDKERLENEVHSLKMKLEGNVKHNSLLDKLEAQQRKISAYELSDKGKDVLVNEYENLLAQNTLLTKKNIKLESELIENQFSGRQKFDSNESDERSCCYRVKQQNDHLESYIKLLKEEINQLVAKKIQSDTTSSHSITIGSNGQMKKHSDLEKTVLTLRGIINKLQSENKRLLSNSDNNHNKKPQILQNSETDLSENKVLQDLRKEKESLKIIIQEKDKLLIRAKDLLKKAVLKEKQLHEQVKVLKAARL